MCVCMCGPYVIDPVILFYTQGRTGKLVSCQDHLTAYQVYNLNGLCIWSALLKSQQRCPNFVYQLDLPITDLINLTFI